MPTYGWREGNKSILPLRLQEWRWRNDSRWRSGSTRWGGRRQRLSPGLPLSHCNTRPLKTPVIIVGHRSGITRMITDFYKDCFPRDTVPYMEIQKNRIFTFIFVPQSDNTTGFFIHRFTETIRRILIISECSQTGRLWDWHMIRRQVPPYRWKISYQKTRGLSDWVCNFSVSCRGGPCYAAITSAADPDR